jgi:hypothetical protein
MNLKFPGAAPKKDNDDDYDDDVSHMPGSRVSGPHTRLVLMGTPVAGVLPTGIALMRMPLKDVTLVDLLVVDITSQRPSSPGRGFHGCGSREWLSSGMDLMGRPYCGHRSQEHGSYGRSFQGMALMAVNFKVWFSYV